MLACKIVEYEVEKNIKFFNTEYVLKNTFNSFVDEISMYNTF